MNSWALGDSGKLNLNAGIRFSYWDLNKDIVFSPRVSISL